MTTYYVIPQVGGASDSNAGTSTGSPWLTIDKATSTAVAGDTVYVAGGWTYRELVTNDNSGSSGSQIVFAADVTGKQTGYGGLAIISAYNDENDRTAGERAACWNLNGKEFVTIRGFTMDGAYGIYDNTLAGNRAYEGVIIEQCACIGNGWGIRLSLGTGATPGGSTGLTIRNCVVSVLQIDHTNNASANVNVKMLIENVIAHGYLSTSGAVGITITGASTNTFSIGGVTIANCTAIGNTYGIAMTLMKNTTNISYAYSDLCCGSSVGMNFSGTAAAVEYYSCANLTTSTISNNGTAGDPFSTSTSIGGLLGGIADFPLLYNFGWSPFRPFEPMQLTGYSPGIIGYGNSNKYLPTQDIYGNPRGMGRPNHWAKFYFNGSTTDPNSVWTNDANISDSSLTTPATVASNGSTSSNYLQVDGTNAPGSGSTIRGVYARFYADTLSSTAEGRVAISTDTWAEVLGTLSQSSTTTDAWTTWTALTTPTGGWSWSVLQNLECRAWRNSGSGTFRVYMVQIAVVTDAGGSDLGAVETRTRPVQNVSTYHNEPYSAEFSGAGFHEDFAAASASTSTTISCWVRWDSNYTGTKPQLKITNIPGVADQTATATGSANTWEQLSINFTPNADGVVRVRLVSNDTSATGKCYFGDLGTTLA